jgi:hypothetical protein
MGYDTSFNGGFTFNKPVTAELIRTINEFSEERHTPGNGIPGYWCQWIIGTDYNRNEALVWDENEKFYNYVEWLEYLIKNFFEPEGYILNGSVEYQGEESDDFGTIEVKDNVVIQNFGIHVMDLSGIETQILIKEIERRGYYVE